MLRCPLKLEVATDEGGCEGPGNRVECRGARRLPVRWPELAGHAGTQGSAGSYTITVQLPDVATLPQNSPVMVNDVTVGSVSGLDAVQRPDGTFYAAVKLSINGDVKLPANARAKVSRPRCWARSTCSCRNPSRKRRKEWLKQGSEIPLAHTAGTRPPKRCCRRWAWW
ncbi:hypothetical protein MPHO_03850 [Mycolicibacterium phocaicum]|nr:hypothetical protein MPHO_03850 [Mycolicibacterium phocaicum]